MTESNLPIFLDSDQSGRIHCTSALRTGICVELFRVNDCDEFEHVYLHWVEEEVDEVVEVFVSARHVLHHLVDQVAELPLTQPVVMVTRFLTQIFLACNAVNPQSSFLIVDVLFTMFRQSGLQ